MSVVPKAHPSASLYVGDLLPTVAEANLFEIFSNVGHIASIRVCRDNLTKRSLGYAYVNFHQVADAERALDTLNNTNIKGRPCRIMWCQRDPSMRKSGVGNIFIKNLDPSIGHKELYDTFSMFGNILSCKVAFDENGQSKGFGFVHFETPESANRAIQMVNDKILKNRKVYVGKFESKKERHKQMESSWTNVFIKDLDPEVSDKELMTAFSKHGNVTSAVIMRKDDGTSKGFGFVNFQHHEDAVKAVDALHGSSLGRNQKIIWCGRAQKKTEREAELQRRFKLIRMERITKFGGINLYIKNLEDDVTEEQLKKEFSAFGKIRSLKIMTDEKGNSRGFGFICFDTPEEAQHAMAEMNNRPLQASTKPLYVALHEPYDIRRQKLAQEQLQRKQNMRPNMLQAVYPPPGYGYPPSTGSPPYVYPSQIVRQQPARNWQQYPPPPHAPYQGQQPPQSQQAQNPAPNRSRQNRNPTSGSSRPKPQGQRRANAPPGGEPISLEQLLYYPPEQQKLLMGEKLYGIISKTQAEKAGKITGMLLDSGWGIEELYSLLESEEKLNQKIEEAVNLLNKQ
jgi:polyadenylate-binding protein